MAGLIDLLPLLPGEHRYLHKSQHRHSGMGCRNPGHKDVENSTKSIFHLFKMRMWACHGFWISANPRYALPAEMTLCVDT